MFANALHAIDDKEFAPLYDVTKPKIPRVPFWHYQSFDLDEMTDDFDSSEMIVTTLLTYCNCLLK